MNDETMIDETGESLLARAHEKRGFHLGVHEIMNEADTEYMQHYQRWLEFANIKERHLDRKTKQIVHVAVDIARNAHPDHIRAHMIAGVKAGVTEEEFFEVRRRYCWEWKRGGVRSGPIRSRPGNWWRVASTPSSKFPLPVPATEFRVGWNTSSHRACSFQQGVEDLIP